MGFRRIEISPWYQVFLVNDQFTTGIRSDPRAVLIVDVGGSHGHDLFKFKEQYPDLPGRLILQDLPETINSLSGELSGIEPMAYNFYVPQPIKGTIESFYACPSFPSIPTLHSIPSLSKPQHPFVPSTNAGIYIYEIHSISALNHIPGTKAPKTRFHAPLNKNVFSTTCVHQWAPLASQRDGRSECS